MVPTEAGQKCTWCIPLASVPPRDVGRRSGPGHVVRNDAMPGQIQPSQSLMTLAVTAGAIDSPMGRSPGSPSAIGGAPRVNMLNNAFWAVGMAPSVIHGTQYYCILGGVAVHG